MLVHALCLRKCPNEFEDPHRLSITPSVRFSVVCADQQRDQENGPNRNYRWEYEIEMLCHACLSFPLMTAVLIKIFSLLLLWRIWLASNMCLLDSTVEKKHFFYRFLILHIIAAASKGVKLCFSLFLLCSLKFVWFFRFIRWISWYNQDELHVIYH